ncbi:LuxR C-terminal-related transcriptional regulator [Lysinibacillus xylanilyticus]|uniref:LuxR C-terminal-related transcriptional regulator n=1 Tax=Lysinibacillus xylanilyticus TaxID=582475 RepID=UPI0038069D93
MYGIEVTLPKASGGTSDPVFAEVQRRVYALNYRIKEYEQKIAEVQNRIPFVEGDREVEVLHRLLNGDSMRAIGKHMKLSSTTIFRVRNNILKQMMK